MKPFLMKPFMETMYQFVESLKLLLTWYELDEDTFEYNIANEKRDKQYMLSHCPLCEVSSNEFLSLRRGFEEGPLSELDEEGRIPGFCYFGDDEQSGPCPWITFTGHNCKAATVGSPSDNEFRIVELRRIKPREWRERRISEIKDWLKQIEEYEESENEG